jgi:hypothetical protein
MFGELQGKTRSMFSPSNMGKNVYLKMSIKELKTHKLHALLNRNYTLSKDLEIIILAKEIDGGKTLSGAEEFSGDVGELGAMDEISGAVGELNSLFGQFYGNGG